MLPGEADVGQIILVFTDFSHSIGATIRSEFFAKMVFSRPSYNHYVVEVYQESGDDIILILSRLSI